MIKCLLSPNPKSRFAILAILNNKQKWSSGHESCCNTYLRQHTHGPCYLINLHDMAMHFVNIVWIGETAGLIRVWNLDEGILLVGIRYDRLFSFKVLFTRRFLQGAFLWYLKFNEFTYVVIPATLCLRRSLQHVWSLPYFRCQSVSISHLRHNCSKSTFHNHEMYCIMSDGKMIVFLVSQHMDRDHALSLHAIVQVVF